MNDLEKKIAEYAALREDLAKAKRDGKSDYEVRSLEHAQKILINEISELRKDPAALNRGFIKRTTDFEEIRRSLPPVPGI